VAEIPPSVVEAPLVLPLSLDVRTLAIMVVGNEGAVVRLAALDERGAANVFVFCENPCPQLIAAAGARLRARWPQESDFSELRPRIVFAGDLSDADSARLYALGRAAGALVHVQDKLPYCDFHMPAILRRGLLQVAVSTGGAAPGLSRLVRNHLAGYLGPEWESRVEETAAARREWKAKGLSFQDLAQALTDLVTAKGWLR
jgi:precorrin-2 dehydrogenase/sirohydrochlorin ferrochelatase